MTSRVRPRADVAVIGGGIAGASAAYHVAGIGRSVLLLEREAQLAHHTTGRSAAVFIVNYGGPVNSRLTKASEPFLTNPPEDLVDGPVLEPRGALMVGDASHAPAIEQMAAEGAAVQPDITLLGRDEILAMVPVLRPEYSAAAMWEPGAKTMDVMGLHQAFVRGATRRGTQIIRNAGVRSIDWKGDHWSIETTGQGDAPRSFEAEVIVDAAGAWGDVVAEMAGVAPVGLRPMRRTAFTVGGIAEADDWPLTHVEFDGGQFYIKPEAGRQLLCSPADEVPSLPCDARPEEIDVASAIDHINAATTLDVRAIKTAWAGLRTFAPDRGPVLGWDDAVENFCWMVGQGGTGITTSVAAGQVVAAAVGRRELPAELLALGLRFDQMAPRR